MEDQQKEYFDIINSDQPAYLLIEEEENESLNHNHNHANYRLKSVNTSKQQVTYLKTSATLSHLMKEKNSKSFQGFPLIKYQPCVTNDPSSQFIIIKDQLRLLSVKFAKFRQTITQSKQWNAIFSKLKESTQTKINKQLEMLIGYMEETSILLQKDFHRFVKDLGMRYVDLQAYDNLISLEEEKTFLMNCKLFCDMHDYYGDSTDCYLIMQRRNQSLKYNKDHCDTLITLFNKCRLILSEVSEYFQVFEQSQKEKVKFNELITRQVLQKQLHNNLSLQQLPDLQNRKSKQKGKKPKSEMQEMQSEFKRQYDLAVKYGQNMKPVAAQNKKQNEIQQQMSGILSDREEKLMHVISTKSKIKFDIADNRNRMMLDKLSQPAHISKLEHKALRIAKQVKVIDNNQYKELIDIS